MSDHTPKPWTVIGPEQPIGINQTPVVDDNEWLVVAEGNLDIGPLEQMYNAYLMAAAPDLLEVLQTKLPCTLSSTTFADDLVTIARVLDSHGYNVTADDLMAKAEAIRAVIADATCKALQKEVAP